jgi:tetratricopeptide (TPR) repeat protein
MQAEAYLGLGNDYEAKKALLLAMEKYDVDSVFGDYFTLGCAEYKLGNKKEAIENLRKFIELAETFIKSSNDNSARAENKKMIEMSNQLINKLEGYRV